MKPHKGVYARIQPSEIHGVGVFAIKRIKKGAYIFPDDNTPIVWLRKSTLKGLPASVRQLYKDFCLIKEKGGVYGCPKNFNQMTVSWYLNHSNQPNLGSDKHFEFFALRNIKKDEELTINYNTYNEFDLHDKGFAYTHSDSVIKS